MTMEVSCLADLLGMEANRIGGTFFPQGKDLSSGGKIVLGLGNPLGHHRHQAFGFGHRAPFLHGRLVVQWFPQSPFARRSPPDGSP